MTVEKNQNSEFQQGKTLTPEQQKQQEAFQSRIDELKKVQLATKSETQKVKKEILTDISLVNLEKNIQALDGRNQEKFQANVEKIEQQLQILENARLKLSSLYTSVQKSNPQLYAQMQSQFPESSEQANQGRAESYLAIAEIKPKV